MIQIIDNFFEDDVFKKIKHHVTTKLYYTPRWFENSKERNQKQYYGSRSILKSDTELQKKFVEQSEKKFKIKIKNIHKDSGIDLRNLKLVSPHVDPCKINILIMISGEKDFFTGTLFYGNEGTIETGAKLDMHIGFKENRAIMFTSDYIHSPFAHEDNDKKRFTASLFVTDYEIN